MFMMLRSFLHKCDSSNKWIKRWPELYNKIKYYPTSHEAIKTKMLEIKGNRNYLEEIEVEKLPTLPIDPYRIKKLKKKEKEKRKERDDLFKLLGIAGVSSFCLGLLAGYIAKK